MNKNRKPRSDGNYLVNVSFTAKEKDLLDYVDSKGSFSSYVKYLIRQDKAADGQITTKVNTQSPVYSNQQTACDKRIEPPKNTSLVNEDSCEELPRIQNKAALDRLLGEN